MECKIHISILLFLLPFSFLLGQEGQMLTMNVFVCDSVLKPIQDVAIYDAKNNLCSVTDRDGLAQVSTRQGDTIYFTHLAYHREALYVDTLQLSDIESISNFNVVTLKDKMIYLSEVDVMAKAPHLAYENKMVWVLDYKVREV